MVDRHNMPNEQNRVPGQQDTNGQSSAQARREANTQNRGNKRSRLKTNLLIATIVVVVLAVAAIVVWAFPVFKAKNVAVEGNAVATVEEIVAAADIQEEQNLLRVDLGEVARRVTELPWVVTAEASLHLPDTVDIKVVEHKAMLFVRHDDGEHLIDEQGKEFVIATPPEGTMEVTGAASQDSAALEAAVTAVQALDDGIRAQIASVEAASPLELTFLLHDGRTIYFGSTDHLEDKVVTMRTALTRGEQHLDISGAPIIAVR